MQFFERLGRRFTFIVGHAHGFHRVQQAGVIGRFNAFRGLLVGSRDDTVNGFQYLFIILGILRLRIDDRSRWCIVFNDWFSRRSTIRSSITSISKLRSCNVSILWVLLIKWSCIVCCASILFSSFGWVFGFSGKAVVAGFDRAGTAAHQQ